MKKFALLAISFILISMLAISASAATAFAQLPVENAVIIDDDTTQDLGGSGQPIQLVDGYGCGYSSMNDMLKYEAVDFGANGAKAMTIYFSYGNEDDTTTTLDVFVDDANSTPVCSYKIGFTGGWEATAAKEFTADCSIPAGKHDVYVKFTNEKSGSFTWISFTEGDPAPETEPETAAPETAAETSVVTPAAQTFDGVIVAAIAVIAAGAAIVTGKRK